MTIRVPRSTLPGSARISVDRRVERRVVQPVDLVVLDRDLAGADRVRLDQGAQDAVDEHGRPLGHLGQVDIALERRFGRELDDLLRDRRRVVAHALELVGHVVQREQVAQVARDRVLGGDRRPR